ncbi:MAG: DUF3990 domain-containing protein [Oscillospiraceae bacterium]|nr:DUF3990 domain-containing protein [Oscillospiraceae bacterium]
MIVYHGGTDIVSVPKILDTFTGRDFGNGFYTTDIREQAIKWARRQARHRNKTEAVLNSYEIDDTILRTLNAKAFDGYSMEWLEFVVNCRSDAAFSHNYDVVIGKIANDDVGETVQAVIDGLMPKDFAMSRLAFMHANNQICFSTQNSIIHLQFITAEKVN